MYAMRQFLFNFKLDFDTLQFCTDSISVFSTLLRNANA